MSTHAFSIYVQKGITGGFAPPTPSAIYTISHHSNSDVLKITVQTRPHGKPSLQPPESKEVAVAGRAGEINNLLRILGELPPQYPGASDLYGRNTSIVLQKNPGDNVPSGSIAGSGISPPTEQQKVDFDQALAIISELVKA